MKYVQYRSTIYFYDVPQVIEARDSFGGTYVGVLTSSDARADQFLFVGVSPESLREFREGLLDLRSLLLEFGEHEWYTAAVQDLGDRISLSEQTSDIKASDWLPDEGFIFHVDAEESSVLSVAKGTDRLAIELSVSPPESASEHRVHVDTFVGLLSGFQVLVKHAYRSAVKDLSQSARKKVTVADAHLLDVVVPAMAGSFKVVLSEATRSDLIGQSEVARAMARIDSLFETVSTPELAIETVKQNQGHLAGAFIRLVRFLQEHRTGLRYSWAAPDSDRHHASAISEAEATRIVEICSGIANLEAEKVVLEGTLEKADENKRQWRLLTSEGPVSGAVKDDGPSLNGVKIGALYRFTCLEEIEYEMTGRERRKFYLIERTPALDR